MDALDLLQNLLPLLENMADSYSCMSVKINNNVQLPDILDTLREINPRLENVLGDLTYLRSNSIINVIRTMVEGTATLHLAASVQPPFIFGEFSRDFGQLALEISHTASNLNYELSKFAVTRGSGIEILEHDVDGVDMRWIRLSMRWGLSISLMVCTAIAAWYGHSPIPSAASTPPMGI